jgi:hypothetical protein
MIDLWHAFLTAAHKPCPKVKIKVKAKAREALHSSESAS